MPMWATGRIFASGVIVLIGSLPVFGIFLPQQMTLYGVVLTVTMGLAAIGARPNRLTGHGFRFDSFSITALIFLIYLALTVFWSIDQEQTVQRILRILGLAVLGSFAIRFSTLVAQRNIDLAWLMAGAVLFMFAMVVFELFTGVLADSVWRDAPPIARANLINRPAAILGLVVWPALFVVWGRGFRLVAIVLGISLPVALGFSSGLGMFMAAALGCVAWVIASIHARLCAGLIGGAFVLSTVVAPFLALNVSLINRGLALCADYDFFSGAHRLAIWNFVATSFRERPWLGWGLDSARALPYGELPLEAVPILSNDLILDYPNFPTLPSSQALPLHPHNAGLQIALETGIVGGALSCLLVLFLALRLGGQANESRAPFALASLASWLVIAGINVGIWQSWWLAAGIILCIFFLIVPCPSRQSRKN